MSHRDSYLAKWFPAAVLLCALIGSAHAQSAAQSGPTLDLRVRHEQVDDAAFARNAQADTVRLRLGYRWVFAPGWQAYVEGAHVQALFGAHYNSTANGKTWYPTIVDPQSSQLNQAFVAYAGDAFAATLGRQRLLLDNQRFFGNSGWRQNEQTFDALSMRYSAGEGGPVVRYVFLDRVQRINGHDNPDPLLRAWNLDGHLLNVSQTMPLGALTGYGYWVRNNDMPTLSTRTLGARWVATQPLAELKLGWTLEYAHQTDWRGNPQSLSADYLLIEPSLSWKAVTFKAGWEVLGGNGRYGFGTPYATLHAFNGWADRFLTTPRNGLDDRYIGASGKLGKAAWVTTWHRYRADHGDQDYGRELDVSLAYPLRPKLGLLLKFADYRAKGFSNDARKLWASIEYAF
ncbi:MAG: alginate export family protein [Dokdonella sp.]|uniref:alginate export family protein n=1 Tax=Dokdonella sp. TaxID=2291710 RepID=UPI0025C35083|nr:alginate export family protein [Dokdonella sp.]MBZ0223898.1 alginate export family protein [Dokdonella sp.]